MNSASGNGSKKEEQHGSDGNDKEGRIDSNNKNICITMDENPPLANRSSMPLKRNSLMADDFDDFDSNTLDIEDDWRDVFDDEDDAMDLGQTTSESSDKRLGSVKVENDNSASSIFVSTPASIVSSNQSNNNSNSLMPPPCSVSASNFDNLAQAPMSTPPSLSTTMAQALAPAIASIEGLSSTNRPPLDHSITRRKKTAGTIDRRDSAPPTWHSQAADFPHRQAMVKDIIKLLYARKKGKNPSRTWLERVPLKAKMLESQLYKNAASLEAYLNRSTLKKRLGKVASAITSHFKQTAADSRRGSTRSSSASISSLLSLETGFSDPRLRRESSSSVRSLPITLNNSHFNSEKNSNVSNSNATAAGVPFAPNLFRRQSDPLVEASPLQLGQKGPSVSMLRGNNANGGVNDIEGTIGMTLQQQQLLASLRQQQRDIARTMNAAGTSNEAVANNTQVTSRPMSSMGGGSIPLLNQQNFMHQQQQNTMKLNFLQQQNFFMQQQQRQQQALTPNGLSLHNITIMQQQQHRQQQQNAVLGLSGRVNDNVFMNSSDGTSLMNSSNASALPYVIPGLEAGLNGNNNPGLVVNSTDLMNMPPPGTPQQGQAATRNGNLLNEDNGSPLSPGSFKW